MLREWKLHFTAAYLVPTLALAAGVCNLCADRNSPFFMPKISELWHLFGVFWPLALCIGLATILPYERLEGMLELRLSFHRPYWHSLLQKVALPIGCWLLAGGAGLYVSHRHYLGFSVGEMLQVIIPPAVALGGFALLISALTLNLQATMLATVSWWGFELATGCRLSGHLALFPVPMNRIDVNLTANRWLLITIGLALAAAAARVLRQRQLPTVEE